jgi:hypothetical protein
MNRPHILQVDYHQFSGELRKATDAGRRVDPADKARWSAWVRQYGIREAAFRSVGGSQFDGLQPVIIDDSGPWGGYYLYSIDEEACLKWIPAEGQ